MSYKIESIEALWILDSRGNPTVRARVRLENGTEGTGDAPSGASTGSSEAHERRDGGRAFGGKGVDGAVEAVNGEIAARLRGMDATHQRAIDRAMIDLDGTENKGRLGANAILPVSLACARAAANALGLPLFRYLGGINAREMPVPMMNVINGGAHAGNNLDIQEFMIRPSGAGCMAEAVRMGAEVYRALGALLREKQLSRAVGDEGGYAPSLESDAQALTLLTEAIASAGYEGRVRIALDVAASGWHTGEGYALPKRGDIFTREQLFDYYAGLTERYPIDSIEDPLHEEDFEGFALLRERLGKRVQIVGDDLFTTHPRRLMRGIEAGSASAVLVKPNQIGTLTEAMETIRLAQRRGMGVVVSHRSGETEDAFIADLSVAVNAGQIKTGAPARTDRTCKYNRLLEIERLLNA